MKEDLVRSRRIKRGWMNLKVVKVISENNSTKTFILEDNDEGGRQFDYTQGQYLTFRFDHIEAKPLVRSYTLSSSPCQKDNIAFTVREVEMGKVSRYLCTQIKAGSILRARGPMGKFVPRENTDHHHLVMIAGGSGVTPFLSIIREFYYNKSKHSHQKMTLIVSYRSYDDLICFEELQKFNDIRCVKIYATFSREKEIKQKNTFLGRINANILDNILEENYEEKTFMTCGPQQMMDFVKDYLKHKNVSSDHIRFESFDN